MDKDHLNILFGGAAGQGLVTVGQILSKSLVRGGYYIAVTQSYQSRIRGGHNTFSIHVGVEEIISPKEQVDLLVAFDAETIDLDSEYLSPEGLILLDEEINSQGNHLLKIPFKKLATERFMNIASFGVIGSILGLDEDLMAETLNHFFGKKDTTLVEENRNALGSAFNWATEHGTSDYKLSKVSNPINHLMMNGNEAIALGAISAGLRFGSFYPMTPSTSIMLNLAANAQRTGLIIEQAEDEISAINMALGASFAGVPSMVSTSGGGFALMVEGVSLAAMTETPIVIVVSQRPGPATGLPTRTEQADLNLVLYAGHGEFPRAILCPGTVEECFHLTRKAFELAERFQGPVFILTDQFLADTYRAVIPFDIEGLPPISVGGQTHVESSYMRYVITKSGISPRLVPGETKHLVIADSDEHTEEGHITEDLSIRKQMVEKRFRKGDGIRKEVIPPDIDGEKSPDILLVSWGSTKGAVLEAASQMKNGENRVATLHFSQVWPIVHENFLEIMENAKETICVEGNATGQLAQIIRRETGFAM
ncbi:2-oxoacid:acceptor oxidoreductase subunit alpha, partial [Thermodesulfobacteriota bacterium]